MSYHVSRFITLDNCNYTQTRMSQWHNVSIAAFLSRHFLLLKCLMLISLLFSIHSSLANLNLIYFGKFFVSLVCSVNRVYRAWPCQFYFSLFCGKTFSGFFRSSCSLDTWVYSNAFYLPCANRLCMHLLFPFTPPHRDYFCDHSKQLGLWLCAVLFHHITHLMLTVLTTIMFIWHSNRQKTQKHIA